MKKNFSLWSLLITVTLVGVGLGLTITFQLTGVVVLVAILLAAVILLTPDPVVRWADRLLLLFFGVGCSFLGWCVFDAWSEGGQLGSPWFNGRLEEIGGWSTGIVATAWRASHMFFQSHRSEGGDQTSANPQT